jgi:hypothetical protein
MFADSASGSGSVGRVASVSVSQPSSSAAKPSLDSIERSYQVAEEASRDWSPQLFGVIPMGGIGGTRNITITEGKLLDNLTRDRGIAGLQRFKGIAADAFATADKRVPPSTAIPAAVEAKIKTLPPEQQEIARKSWPRNDGHNDAFRHAYWNARLTAAFGESWAKQFTTAHEGSNPGSSTREAMDLYNNEVGRRIALENPGATPAQLADKVKEALDNGRLVVIDKSGHLAWSNMVANGDHGLTIDLPGVRANLATPGGNASAN